MRRSLVLALLLAMSCAAGADDEPVAANGMVVTTTGDGAAEAGVASMRKGGNAMDAAMTAALMQPCLAAGSYVSYAGIMNVVYYEAASGKVFNLSAGFNTVLAETDPLTIPGVDMTAAVKEGPAAFQSAASGRTALVPGFFAGVEAAHRRFGKRRFGELLAPAIECAERGFKLRPELAWTMKSRESVLRRLPETRAIFIKADGNLFEAGDMFRQPALAKTLRAISKQGVSRYVYQGGWANAFVASVQREGGKLALPDMLAYQPTWIEPVRTTFNGFEVYAHGLPSSGGPTLIEGLNLATAARLTDLPPYQESPEALFWLIQFTKASTILGTPSVSDSLAKAYGIDLAPGSRLTQPTANQILGLIRDGRMPLTAVPKLRAPAHSDAVVAIDGDGNVAAVVHTINTVNWGSTGIFVGGISIPDSASFQQVPIASLKPGSRLPDQTAPGIALRDGKAALGFSCIGSGLNLRTLAALVDTLGHGKTPGQAIASPSLSGLDWSKATAGEVGALVGKGELSEEYRLRLRNLGQTTAEDDAQRGYWIGIAVDPRSRQLRGGALREMSMGGVAAGY